MRFHDVSGLRGKNNNRIPRMNHGRVKGRSKAEGREGGAAAAVRKRAAPHSIDGPRAPSGSGRPPERPARLDRQPARPLYICVYIYSKNGTRRQQLQQKQSLPPLFVRWRSDWASMMNMMQVWLQAKITGLPLPPSPQ